ncbi:putative multicopper oxidase [Bradyrhizobium oligotrophicum S58]|uniref:Putative multicopper oxidase n=1 Tax=Bradyrhizobium oligotrophicum S58 TaxID=1245469 RepID=M4Z488_9BRAD|nr:hypothetical protein [Bradyrhizobium oligotrophicum]BAM87757.1 putative multicopper oxidase [Bradyrhizobium oligotrophicum S58]
MASQPKAAADLPVGAVRVRDVVAGNPSARGKLAPDGMSTGQTRIWRLR